ncbi:MAG: formate C-acetyltransferase [Firmicutes bacterium]|nr:formate C-acetyltransferase [Bacillota bacterium]
MKAWRGFKGEGWRTGIDVAGFIQENYHPYEGDERFLEKATERTTALWEKVCALRKKELENDGVLDIDVTKVSSLLTYEPGYIDRENERIFGLQTDAPLKRGVNPFGGIRMARQACEAYGYKLSDQVEEHFAYKTTHNEGVFRVYSEEMKRLRSAGVLTGLPDAYGRGRIIGDYRRVALYGVDHLIAEKKRDKRALEAQPMLSDTIQLIEEVHRQIDFLGKLKVMAQAYGDDIGRPAETGREAIQWLYYGYLGAIKEQNGAAMSLGRVGTFIDIYLERDLKEGTLDESHAQALIDDFVIKLRLARQLRTPEYNTLFAGDPLWITESIGGMGCDGRTLVTKTAYRFLHTLENLGPAPEPNMTVLWSDHLPAPFKHYVAKMSVRTDAIQYENDDLMRPLYGDDYAIACCVSAMRVGKEMQFFGARCNLAKVLLMALNDGRDEMTGDQIALKTMSSDRGINEIDSETISDDAFTEGQPLDYERVMRHFDAQMAWICNQYVNTMNVIHYMHDKYAYEKTQMALHDTHVHRYMAFGIAGLSVVADELSAIKYAKVTPVMDERGIITDFTIEGDFPKYGNDDDRVDDIAVQLTERFTELLKAHPTYRNAEHTLSVLTITSNVVYGSKTGSTPDGRKRGEAFAPGANPMHGREVRGALAALNSVAKLPFKQCRDGISYTFSVSPNTLGQDEHTQSSILVQLMGGFFRQNAHHLNVNVIDREKLVDAMAHPERYPNLTIRVSGYAVNFHQLSANQQLEVINRTYHERF